MNPDNSLLPRSYSRVQTPYLKQNRKETFAVAYGDSNKSYTFPESLRILLNAYVRVELPENASGNYKQIPGLHIIKTVHIRCNGDLVYSTPYRSLVSDHLASLKDETAKAYAEAHLGYVAGAASGAARDCWLRFPCRTLRSGSTEGEDRERYRSRVSARTKSRSPLTSMTTPTVQPIVPTHPPPYKTVRWS